MNAKPTNPSLKPERGHAMPRRCRRCGKNEFVTSTTSFDAEVRHDGRLHKFTIPNLELPVCRACGERVFTEAVDDQINAHLRAHLRLFTPDQIRAAIDRIGMTQTEAADRMGIAEATLSRWLSGTQIQSRSLDNLMRVFFAFPEIRAALDGRASNPSLGTRDQTSQQMGRPSESCDQVKSRPDSSWLDQGNGLRTKCQSVQVILLQTGTTWGRRRAA